MTFDEARRAVEQAEVQKKKLLESGLLRVTYTVSDGGTFNVKPSKNLDDYRLEEEAWEFCEIQMDIELVSCRACGKELFPDEYDHNCLALKPEPKDENQIMIPGVEQC